MFIAVLVISKFAVAVYQLALEASTPCVLCIGPLLQRAHLLQVLLQLFDGSGACANLAHVVLSHVSDESDLRS
jgi:hypothetical protein